MSSEGEADWRRPSGRAVGEAEARRRSSPSGRPSLL